MKVRDLDELRVFAQIVESGSLTGAAEVLQLPTSTVSRRLAMLEDRLGTKLIFRSTRSLSLSEPGRSFLRTARLVLDEIAAAEVALERDVEGLSGVVRIGVVSILSEDLLEVLAPLLREHPALRIEVQVSDRPMNPVSAGLDVAIYGGTLDDSGLVARKLFDIELHMAATSAYLDQHGTPKKPQDLVDHEILSFVTSEPSWTLIDKSGGQNVVQLTGRLTSNDARTVRDALLGGMGIGVTSSRVFRRHPELRRVLPQHRLARVPLYAVFPAAMQRSARLLTVVDYLRDALLKAS